CCPAPAGDRVHRVGIAPAQVVDQLLHLSLLPPVGGPCGRVRGMARSRVSALSLTITLPLAACGLGDPNAAPTYGETTGLPKNCRAIVQANIDGYRSGQFTADEAMNSLERNCGADGYSWGE